MFVADLRLGLAVPANKDEFDAADVNDEETASVETDPEILVVGNLFLDVAVVVVAFESRVDVAIT